MTWPRVLAECQNMENLVAVAVDFTDIGTRYFIAYGRIFGAVEYEAIEAAVLKAAQQSDYGGTPLTATVCRALHEASAQPYFYEALFDMTRDAVSPGTRKYERWRRRIARSMSDGREIWFLGHPE